MRVARTLAKELVYGLANASGLPRHAGRHRGAGLIVLTYHSVGQQAEHPYLNRMPPERFAAQVRYLKKNYEVISVADGLARMAAVDDGRSFTRPMVAITVDDGYSDNFHHLHPVVQAEGVPITVFLATDYLDSGRLPWPTRISALLHFATSRRCTVPDPAGAAQELPLETAQQRLAAGTALRNALSRLDHEDRERALVGLARELAPRDMNTLPPLSWVQVRRMQQAGVRFGSHTCFHAWLDRVGIGEASIELVAGKDRVEQETGVPCDIVAYPNGNHSPGVREAASRAGYRYGLTQERGINPLAFPDPYALRRIEIPFNERLGTFACRVAGLAL